VPGRTAPCPSVFFALREVPACCVDSATIARRNGGQSDLRCTRICRASVLSEDAQIGQAQRPFGARSAGKSGHAAGGRVAHRRLGQPMVEQPAPRARGARTYCDARRRLRGRPGTAPSAEDRSGSAKGGPDLAGSGGPTSSGSSCKAHSRPASRRAAACPGWTGPAGCRARQSCRPPSGQS